MTKNDDFDMCIFADGGSRGNPGPSGIGAVLFDKTGKRVKEIARYVGVTTNNVAEYLAVIYALQEALFQKAAKVLLHIDSQLVAKQVSGQFKVKDQNIQSFFDLVINLVRLFEKVEIEQIPRSENRDADKLVNKAIGLKTQYDTCSLK